MEIGVLMVLVVIGTSIWVGLDSSRLMRDITPRDRKGISSLSSSPAQWVLGSLLLWIICFPLYLITRPKYVAHLERRDMTEPSDARRPSQCPSCTKYYEGAPAYCPNCGAKLGPKRGFGFRS